MLENRGFAGSGENGTCGIHLRITSMPSPAANLNIPVFIRVAPDSRGLRMKANSSKAFNRKGGTILENGLRVVLFEKLPGGELRQIEERLWTMNMIAALEHVNYLIVGGQEYETVEGRLNVDSGTLDLLLVPLRHE